MNVPVQKDLLIEIGTEELPPKALKTLMEAFGENLVAELDSRQLTHGQARVYASPRRLAVMVTDLADRQESRRIEQKGPPVRIAFDDDGNPQPAAVAFAKKCGVDITALQRVATDKGEWLVHESIENGDTIDNLLPGAIEAALAALPIPRRMRWGDSDTEFVRPVHWIVALHGDDVIEMTVMGLQAGRLSRGHRFHANGDIEIASPAAYLQTLRDKGYVIADFAARRNMVVNGVTDLARDANGEVVNGDALYDEVTALVEWPVPVLGSFDDTYLELPYEAVVSTLTSHQRYFPLANADGDLLPQFITVANIESKDPAQVRDGNERVIRPRLADAAFFYQTDRQRRLEDFCDDLNAVVYQQGLGSLLDKSQRTAKIARMAAEYSGEEPNDIERAALLAKCDLLTGMVGEFPELQGTMGRYYAEADGEDATVAQAIEDQYRPRHSGDALPANRTGQLLALADKLDTLAGVFALGKKPSGNRDPFGLRRAALGVVRLLVECELPISLKKIIAAAVELQPPNADVADDVYQYVIDRLRGYFLDQGVKPQSFDAVLAREPATLLDFARRVAAVQSFLRLDAAASLAAANKRIANILKKAADAGSATVDPGLFSEAAESELYEQLRNSATAVAPMLADARYTDALTALAELRGPVDKFFDDVMVMADDPAVRNNRLALLGQLRSLFLDVADISRLAIS